MPTAEAGPGESTVGIGTGGRASGNNLCANMRNETSERHGPAAPAGVKRTRGWDIHLRTPTAE